MKNNIHNKKNNNINNINNKKDKKNKKYENLLSKSQRAAAVYCMSHQGVRYSNYEYQEHMHGAQASRYRDAYLEAVKLRDALYEKYKIAANKLQRFLDRN